MLGSRYRAVTVELINSFLSLRQLPHAKVEILELVLEGLIYLQLTYPYIPDLNVSD